MKNIMKKALVLFCAGAMLAGSAFSAFAASPEDTWLSLGEDLSESEKSTVLDLLGVDEEDLDDYNVTTVSNSEEHQYLDGYISSDQIGTQALSSVLIRKTEAGSGLHVTTKNITFCTEGMYTNALTTAGITDAEVMVAGPYPISGTAALIGAAKAFAEMNGSELDEKAIDGALDEMITTGQLEEVLGADPEAVEGMIAELKEKAAAGNIDLGDPESVNQAIEELAQKYSLELTPEQLQMIRDLLDKLSGLNLNLDNLSQQVHNLTNKLEDMGITSEQAKSWFARFLDWLRSLLPGLF